MQTEDLYQMMAVFKTDDERNFHFIISLSKKDKRGGHF